MLLLRIAGPAAVFCGGLVLGAGFAALTDGAASARPDAASPRITIVAHHPQRARAVHRQIVALRVIGLPHDGTNVPERLVPPSLRTVSTPPAATYATTGADPTPRLRPLHGHGGRRILGRA